MDLQGGGTTGPKGTVPGGANRGRITVDGSKTGTDPEGGESGIEEGAGGSRFSK